MTLGVLKRLCRSLSIGRLGVVLFYGILFKQLVPPYLLDSEVVSIQHLPHRCAASGGTEARCNHVGHTEARFWPRNTWGCMNRQDWKYLDDLLTPIRIIASLQNICVPRLLFLPSLIPWLLISSQYPVPTFPSDSIFGRFLHKVHGKTHYGPATSVSLFDCPSVYPRVSTRELLDG